VQDEAGHERTQKSVSSEKSFFGELDKSCRRKFTADDKLFFFQEFCKHHNFNATIKEDVEAAKDLALQGGEGCAWNIIALRIARETQRNMGQPILLVELNEQHCASVSRTILKDAAMFLSAVDEISLTLLLH